MFKEYQLLKIMFVIEIDLNYGHFKGLSHKLQSTSFVIYNHIPMHSIYVDLSKAKSRVSISKVKTLNKHTCETLLIGNTRYDID